jgi:hypothetical protein
MAAYNKFRQFVQDRAHGVHNLGSNQLKIALTNTAPNASNSVLADLTEVNYANCSTRDLTTSSSAQSAGTYKLVLADLTLTASGGSVGPFRYVVLYNDTPTSPNKPLIAWFDYGSSITLANGESLLIDFHDTNGVFTDS